MLNTLLPIVCTVSYILCKTRHACAVTSKSLTKLHVANQKWCRKNCCSPGSQRNCQSCLKLIHVPSYQKRSCIDLNITTLMQRSVRNYIGVLCSHSTTKDSKPKAGSSTFMQAWWSLLVCLPFLLCYISLMVTVLVQVQLLIPIMGETYLSHI